MEHVHDERCLEARAFLLRARERAEWCFLLGSGLAREYYVDESGAEHTLGRAAS